MNNSSLLRATRDLYILAEKPNSAITESTKYWSLKVDGLDPSALRSAVNRLREKQLPHANSYEEKQALKATALYDSIARSLGAKSHRHWLNEEYPKIQKFLEEHGMHTPTDLITCSFLPRMTHAFTGQRIAERFFNSGFALPRRVFTGVGSNLFAPKAYGRVDFDHLTRDFNLKGKEERLNFCIQRADQVLLRAVYLNDECPLPYLDLTGRMLLLHTYSEFVGGMYNLLGHNLMDPMVDEPVIRSYNTNEQERAFDSRLFQQFRAEIESSSDGWIEVIPMRENRNIIFLKGPHGSFDWVIRDQRDDKFSSNELYPFFNNYELPRAISHDKLRAHLYFSIGNWFESLEHRAEESHYANGGTATNWPGYTKLIERKLIADGFHFPRAKTGAPDNYFVQHRLGNYCLMVSPLISIREFFEFYIQRDWGQSRLERARRAGWDIEGNLMSVNSDSDQSLPVSVTWLDAIAYCSNFENKHSLPVRLLSAEEWRQIVPQSKPVARELTGFHTFEKTNDSKRPIDTYYKKRGWCTQGSDGRFGKDSADCYMPAGQFFFNANFKLFSNSEGLEFVESPGFGEWLDNDGGHFSAPIVAAYANHEAKSSIETDLYSIKHTLLEEGFKTGFRLCYIANADS